MKGLYAGEYYRLINRKKYFSVILKALSYLVSFLSYFSRFFPKKTNNKVAVIALHKLGDSIFTIPAIKCLREKYDEKIVVVCFPETRKIFENGIKNVNILEIKHEWIYFNNRLAGSTARKKLKMLNPFLLFDLTGTITSASLIFNCGAPKINGLNDDCFKPIYSSFTPIRSKPHLIDNYLNVVTNHNSSDSLEKQFTSDYEKSASILIQPFAGWPAKEWGINRYLKLAKNISEKFKCCMILPPNRADIVLITELERENINYKITESIEELIRMIKECSLFISNDSGPIQIAAMLGKPTFTIYGPTNPDYHLPYGDQHKFAQKIIKCSPKQNEKMCFTNGGIFGCPAFECISNLSYVEVEQKIFKFISNLELKETTFS